MFGAVPSGAADLVLIFPTAAADFHSNNWISVKAVTVVTPGV